METKSKTIFPVRYNREYLFYIFFFLLLWIYLWLRAAFTQLTHDETATFFRYIQLGRFFPYHSEWSANNHILNSFVSFIFYKLLGPDALVLRLGNLLAFPLFFYFLVKISGLVCNKVLRISLVVILSLTHNFIEFFAMSRGYGLSLALLMASLWYLILSFRHVKSRDYFLCLLFALLALTANLTLLNSLLILLALLIIKLVSSNRPYSIKHWLWIIMMGVAPIVFFTLFLFELKERGELYYGLTTGFWEVTVRTLVNTMLDPGSYLIEIFAGIYFTFILVFGLYFIYKKPKWQVLFNEHLLFFYLLLGNIVAVILLRNIFSVNYPEDRTGLYFVIYFIASIFYISDLIIRRWKLQSIYMLLIPLFFIPVHFLFNMNLTHNSFENHKIPKSFYDTIAAYHQPNDVPPTIGGYKARELRWAWHNYQHGGKLGKVHGSLYPSIIEDFQIVDSAYHPLWKKHYKVAAYHPQSGFHLLKRTKPAKKTQVFAQENIKTPSVTEQEYFNLLVQSVDSLGGEHVQIVFDLHFNTPARPFKSWLVASVRNSGGEEIRYEYFALDWLKYNWEGDDGHVLNSMIVPFPEESEKLIFYIWNVLKAPYSLEKGDIRIYNYQNF